MVSTVAGVLVKEHRNLALELLGDSCVQSRHEVGIERDDALEVGIDEAATFGGVALWRIPVKIATPMTRAPAPMANSISVVEGMMEMMRCGGDCATATVRLKPDTTHSSSARTIIDVL